jgi:hypothetical protein
LNLNKFFIFKSSQFCLSKKLRTSQHILYNISSSLVLENTETIAMSLS